MISLFFKSIMFVFISLLLLLRLHSCLLYLVSLPRDFLESRLLLLFRSICFLYFFSILSNSHPLKRFKYLNFLLDFILICLETNLILEDCYNYKTQIRKLTAHLIYLPLESMTNFSQTTSTYSCVCSSSQPSATFSRSLS